MKTDTIDFFTHIDFSARGRSSSGRGRPGTSESGVIGQRDALNPRKGHRWKALGERSTKSTQAPIKTQRKNFAGDACARPLRDHHTSIESSHHSRRLSSFLSRRCCLVATSTAALSFETLLLLAKLRAATPPRPRQHGVHTSIASSIIIDNAHSRKHISVTCGACRPTCSTGSWAVCRSTIPSTRPSPLCAAAAA